MPAPRRQSPTRTVPNRASSPCAAPRFAIAALCALLCAPPPGRAAPAAEHLAPEDRKALEAFKLTPDLMERASSFHLKLADRLRTDPKARQAKLLELDAGSLPASVRRMESSPVLAAALKEAKLSARDYLLVSMASITAAMVVALEAGGRRFPAPPEGTNAANVAFLEKDGAAAFEKFQATGTALLEAGKPKGKSVKDPEQEAGSANEAK